ncbi:MAG: hypothetical protein ABIO72_00250 [Patescibacteria group bacterium]
MANALEIRPTLDSHQERESGVFEKSPDAKEGPMVSFEELEGDALMEVENAAFAAENYAMAEGHPELAVDIRKDMDATKEEVRKATDEEAAKAGIAVERPKKKGSKETKILEPIPVFIAREVEGYQQKINRLEEDQHRTGAPNAEKIQNAREAREVGLKIRENPVAIAAVAALMVASDRSAERIEAVLSQHVPEATPDAVKQWSRLFIGEKKSVSEKEEKKAEEGTVKKMKPEVAVVAGPTEREEEKKGFFSTLWSGTKTVGTLGGAAGFIGLGAGSGAFNGVARVFEGLDAFLGIFTSKKKFLDGLEGALDWITKKLGGKTSKQKNED